MFSTYLSLLHEFIAFRSISTDAIYKDEINACADRLIDLFDRHDFQTKKISGYGNPLIYAHYEADPSYQTILIYGHYDVQPADQDDGWQSDPFSLDERDGRLYARGAADNKGQIMIHIATVLDLLNPPVSDHLPYQGGKNGLAYNITFLIEGDEETGLPPVQALLDHRDLFTADMALISDGEIIGDRIPTIVAGMRGSGNVTLTIQTATTDVHSGLYGNIVMNASHVASDLIAQLYDERNHITIPGRYDDMDMITDAQRDNNARVPREREAMMTMIGAQALAIPEGYDAITANGLLPTIQVTSIVSGYIGVGYRNSIPGSVIVKINFRFAPGQDPDVKMAQFMTWIQDTLPDMVSHHIETDHMYPAITISSDHVFYEPTLQILADAYGQVPILRYCGATLPMAGVLQNTLGLPLMIIDLANEDCQMHAVDENMSLVCIEKGLRFSEMLLGKVS